MIVHISREVSIILQCTVAVRAETTAAKQKWQRAAENVRAHSHTSRERQIHKHTDRHIHNVLVH